jgi:hypothetical protein
MRIPFFSDALFNARMKTIDEIHRERLVLLKNEFGGVGKLAEKLEKSGPQVSQWLNASTHSETGKARGISDEMCRYVEERCEKPRGWMDSDPDRADAVSLLRLISLFLQCTEHGQEQILTFAETAEKMPKRS